MATDLSDLSDDTGLATDKANQGMGALLAMLKGRLDPDAFARLKNAIPGSDHLLSAFDGAAGSEGGGLLSTVKEMAAKFLGGSDQDGVSALKSHFANIGLSEEHLNSLVQKFHAMVEGKLPPDLLARLREHLPKPGDSPS
jgi:hypothetical protein